MFVILQRQGRGRRQGNKTEQDIEVTRAEKEKQYERKNEL